jgi:hypothetical protein
MPEKFDFKTPVQRQGHFVWQLQAHEDINAWSTSVYSYRGVPQTVAEDIACVFEHSLDAVRTLKHIRDHLAPIASAFPPGTVVNSLFLNLTVQADEVLGKIPSNILNANPTAEG